MKQVFNCWNIVKYPAHGIEGVETLQRLLSDLQLDGIEYLLQSGEEAAQPLKKHTVGVHLCSYYNWWDFYRENKKGYQQYYPDENALLSYFGSTNAEGWVEHIRQDILRALKYNPEYLVWHVTNVTPKEAFTLRYTHSNRDILEAAAEIFKLTANVIPKNVKVLFENLWWPGLNLQDLQDLEYFLQLVEGYNVGLMVDTGHLLNCSSEATCEERAIAFLQKEVLRLKPYKNYINGLHLNMSLSAEYRASCNNLPKDYMDNQVLYEHVYKIDQHRCFTDKRIKDVVESFEVDYLNHELSFGNGDELRRMLTMQMNACR